MKSRLKRTLAGVLRKREGFTLIEFVVVTVVTGLIVVTTVPFFKIGVESYLRIRAGKDIQQMGRIGFNRMIAEMKLIEASLDIDYGYSNSIRFDIPNQNNINYDFESGALAREGEILVQGVQSFQLTYFRADGSQKSSGFWYDSDVWRVHIEMEVGDGDNNMVFKGQVSPRNIHL